MTSQDGRVWLGPGSWVAPSPLPSWGGGRPHALSSRALTTAPLSLPPPLLTRGSHTGGTWVQLVGTSGGVVTGSDQLLCAGAETRGPGQEGPEPVRARAPVTAGAHGVL